MMHIRTIPLKARSGITFIEMLVVIGLLVLLVSAAFPIYSNLQTQAQLNNATATLIQTIRTAREQSVAGINDSAHGVFFDVNVGADSYTLYQGDSYATRNSTYDRVFGLEPAFVLTTTIPGDDLNFSRGKGEPNNTGNVTLTHSALGANTITVNSVGLIEEQ